MSEGAVHPNSTDTGASAVDQVAELLVSSDKEEAHQIGEPDNVTDTPVDYGEEATSEEVEVEAAVSEDEGDAHETEDSQQDETVDDHEEVGGLEALASELGLDNDKLVVDDDGDVFVKLKVNGKDEHVSLKDAIAQTQYYKANEEKSQVLAEERKTFESERTQVAEHIGQRLQYIQNIGQALEQKLMGEFNTIDWDRLRMTDPAEWAAKQQEFQYRQQELQQMGEAVGQQVSYQNQQADEVYQRERQETLAHERVALTQAVPEWNDEAKMGAEMQDIIRYARENGFPDEELQDVTMSRHVVTLRKAMLYDQGKTVAQQKVKKAPKMQRAANGQFVKKKQSQLDNLVKAAKTAKGANKRMLERDAVASLLMGE
jgi:hypothetical protein